jgi:uncharacterized phage-associated protein
MSKLDESYTDQTNASSYSITNYEKIGIIETGRDEVTTLYEEELPPQEKNDGFQAVSVFDVAAYLLKKLGPLSTMKLQKLVYYCQVWSLVWDEKQLFEDEIEAWANGPVVRRLFDYHRGYFQISSLPLGNPDSLDSTQKETVDAVIDYYGTKPAQWLIDLTHMEPPWIKAREGLSLTERGNKVIKLDDIIEYYSSLRSE